MHMLEYFYQDLCQDTEWLPDFKRNQPFQIACKAGVAWRIYLEIF